MATRFTANVAQEPTALFLSLETESFFDESYAKLIDEISSRATIERATTPDRASQFLKETPPSAVIVTDPSITKKYRQVLPDLRTYIANGGKCIFGGHFSGSVLYPDLDVFFKDNFDLPWTTTAYTKSETPLNVHASAKLKDPAGELSPCYHQKALFLKGVDPGDALYSANAEQAAVAFAKFGLGRVGYVGDVNPSEGSTYVTLAMCGLLADD